MKETKTSVEEAKAILQKEEEAKMNKFVEEYRELCKKHGYELAPVQQFNIIKLNQ